MQSNSSQRFAVRKVRTADHDQPRYQDEKHNCGGDRPPVVLRAPWIGPATIGGRHENHLRRVNGGLSNSLAWLAAVENVSSRGWVPGLQPNREQTHCVGQSVISADTLTTALVTSPGPVGGPMAVGRPRPVVAAAGRALTPIRALPDFSCGLESRRLETTL
jgi:hypothetical protein